MFKIQDGREHFWQWDLNRKLIVEDKTIKEVHFSNMLMNTALTRKVLNGAVDVPNVILQDNCDLLVYGYDSEATRHEATFEVKKRSKPTNYVYNDEEIKVWEDLYVKINQIETNGVSEEALAGAISKYMNDNPPQVDFAGYATEEYVDDAIAAIDIPEVDLSDYAKKSEIPNIDLTPYATKAYVGEEIAKAQLNENEVDLSDYATINYVNNSLKGYARIADIPSTTGFATETYVNDKIAAIPKTDLTNYYTKTEVGDMIPDVSAYQTADQVNSAITNALNAIGVAEEGAY